MAENNLRYYRKQQKLTLKDLSDLTGLSIGYLSHLETGSRENPSRNTMLTISKAVNTSIEDIFSNNEEEEGCDISKLPTELKLTLHAKQRLEERKNHNTYNTKNLMKSSCRWYGKDDLIPNSKLYVHCLYVCRKAKNKMGYLTDGNIEVLYDKNAKVVITVMEVKEKFLPITQYIKPGLLRQIEVKKEKKKMRKMQATDATCPDCGKSGVNITSQGICVKCRTRKSNMKARNKEYIPYIELSIAEKKKIDSYQKGSNKRLSTEETEVVVDTPQIIQSRDKKATINISDEGILINTLKSCGSEIPEEDLKEVLKVLIATDKLKDLFTTITKDDYQQAMLDLEQALNVVERKLQHDWEYNGFREEDDIKFKHFLSWRRVLKGNIYFWKKLYQTNTLVELQRAWNAYVTDPTEKVVMAGDRMSSMMKRYQITTDSISTIYNTRKPFTRVFYASSEEEAYKQFVKWMSDRQLHEDKAKTTIVELSTDGEDGRKEVRTYND